MMGGSSMPAKPIRPLGQFANQSATNQMGNTAIVWYGRRRFGGKFVSDFFDIKVVKVSNGGKGGSSAGSNNYASFAAVFGVGQATKFCDLYFNGDSVYTDTTKLYAASLAMTNNVATFQTKNAHGLTSGQIVSIYYAFQPEFNGEFTITVVSDTQFQYTIPGTSIPNETATPQSGQKIYALVHLDPVSAGGDVETSITIPDFCSLEFGWGREDQTANAYLNNISGIQHPTYAGRCRAVFHQCYLGFNQSNAQNVEAELENIPKFDWLTNPDYALVDDVYGTCNPAIIVADRLLNKRSGLRLTEDDLDITSFNAAAEYFYDAGIGFTPLWDRGEAVRSQISEILEKIDATLVEDDDGKIKLIWATSPDDPSAVTEDNLNDLPDFPAADWSQVATRSYLTFVDADAGGASDYVPWSDTAAVYGKLRPDPLEIDCTSIINNRALAQQIIGVLGPIKAMPKKTGTLKLNYDDDLFDALAPGNAFQFTYDLTPELNAVYRVTSRSLPDPASAVFEVSVEIDRSYLYTLAETPSQKNYTKTAGSKNYISKVLMREIISDPIAPDLQPIPAPSPAAFVELPIDLCPHSKPAIAALVTRNTASDSLAQIYLGRNYVFNGDAPESYFLLAAINGFAFHGALMADFLAAAAALDIANALPAEGTGATVVAGLAIKLDGVDLELPDVCDFDALANSVLLFVGNEIMSIAEATMSEDGAYTLTVIRGRFGTPIEDHSADDEVWIIGLSDLKPLQHPHFLAGNDAQFKLTVGGENLSDADSVDVTFAGNRWNFPVYLQQPPAGM